MDWVNYIELFILKRLFNMESAGEDNAPIISTDELVGILDQPNLKILDCSTQFGR